MLSVSAADHAAAFCGLITAAGAALAVSAAARSEADSAAVQPEVNAAAAGSEAAAAAAVRTSRWEVGGAFAGRVSMNMAADDDTEVTSSWSIVEAGHAADCDTAAGPPAGEC